MEIIWDNYRGRQDQHTNGSAITLLISVFPLVAVVFFFLLFLSQSTWSVIRPLTSSRGRGSEKI